jgi:hypothetical protein
MQGARFIISAQANVGIRTTDFQCVIRWPPIGATGLTFDTVQDHSDTSTPSVRRHRRGKPLSTGGSRKLHLGALGAGVVNGNSWEARYLKAYEQMLTAHVGGHPNGVQRALITRACRLALFVEKMDEKALADGTMSQHAANQYLAWSNGLRRTLVALGIKAAAKLNDIDPEDLKLMPEHMKRHLVSGDDDE